MFAVQSAPQRYVADHAAASECHAYNAAFDELGLNWYWDSATYASLLGHDEGCVRRYLETEQPHLLRAYEPEFIVAAVEATKARLLCGTQA